jgi:hypothetical protein
LLLVVDFIAMRILSVVLLAVLVSSLLRPTYGETYEEAVRKMAENGLREWASHPTIVGSVRAQNQNNRGMSPEQIATLDRRWRSEVASPSKPMVQALMANVLSSFLSLKKRRSNGLITEIIVMDEHGLNAGLSDMTTDYWQGDEDKWRKTYLEGPGSIHISRIMRDESTGHLQSQLSLPVVDPDSGKAIGAVTIGIDISTLFLQKRTGRQTRPGQASP